MFVFKAAVVGAGTMGGEIAQTLAAADLPVVLKDVDQKFVDQGLEKARQVTEGQLQALVKKEKLTEEQAKQQLEHTVGLITGTTTYDGFGDVDFVVEAVPERIEIKRQVFAELDAVHAGSRDPFQQHILALDHRDGRRDAAPRQGDRLPLLLSGLGDAADRGGGGRGDLRRDGPDTINFVQQIRKMPIRCGEVPGFVVNRILNSAASEIWRHKDETGLSVQDIDKEIAEARVTPMGPFFLSDLLGLDTVLHVAEHLHESYGDRFYVSPEMQSLVAAGNFGQKTGKGFYDHGKNGS